MQIKQIQTDKSLETNNSYRPINFDEFIGQEHVKNILQTAVTSALHRKKHLWHILLAWSSGYGKTTLAQIISHQAWRKIHIITWYAISKPADIISILTSMESDDILFIDEIHRLKPTIEEMLYIAMEDFAIDMVMPDGGNVRVPLSPFTLIGATTKPESLSQPLKNRFVYNCHLIEYSENEKFAVVSRYLNEYDIILENVNLIPTISKKVDSVPREIHNFCVKIRDFLISHNEWNLTLSQTLWDSCESWLQVKDWGITPVHQKYLDILSWSDTILWLKTISLQMGLNEKTVEDEIEPLLIKLWKVQKTSRGRKLIEE